MLGSRHGAGPAGLQNMIFFALRSAWDSPCYYNGELPQHQSKSHVNRAARNKFSKQAANFHNDPSQTQDKTAEKRGPIGLPILFFKIEKKPPIRWAREEKEAVRCPICFDIKTQKIIGYKMAISLFSKKWKAGLEKYNLKL